jgi:flagellar hook-associated protein 1 FlgK
MSFLGINIAGSALDTFQEAEDVTSQNIANVQTPGASRQIINIGQLPPIDGNTMFPNGLSPGTQGTGVLVTSIKRVHQDSYDALFRGATASQSFFSAEQGVLTGLQSGFGEPANGINAAYSNFQTSVQTLANNPQGNAERSGLLTSAQALVVSLNKAGDAIQSSEVQTQSQAGSLITTINSTIDQIAALNGQIRAATAVGDNPNTYEDQRDQLIDTLSTYINTSTAVQADGSTLVTVDGQALVNDTVAYHLAAPIVGTNPNGTPALQVDFVGPPPSPVTPPAVNITGGQLGGLLDTYNNKLVTYGAQINDFANALATESDRISQAGYDLTGQAGGQLFSPVVTQLPISAGNIQVGISTPNEVPAATASTSNGTLVQALNAANSTVDTTATIDGNVTLSNPPAAPLSGTLTVSDDGINQVFDYSTVPALTTSTSATAVGATVINVSSTAGLVAGQTIVIGSGDDQESTTIAAVGPGNTITVAPLLNAHGANETVGGNAGSIDAFINSFNAGHYGVTASFDSTSQTIVFARDPTNIDLVHRALQGANATTPDFTISDSNIPFAAQPVGSTAQPALGVPALNLLTAFGANQINGVNQNGTNAFGSTSGANVSALQTLFTASFGTPALQTQVAIPPGGYAAGSQVTLTGAAGPPPAFAQLNVGDVLTIYDGNPPSTANQENVTITQIDRNTNTITFNVKNAHVAPATVLYISSAQTSTLQQSYANLVAKMGLDAATATTGNATQSTLASNVNQVRQSTDGINIDEETQNLVKFQNAYGAAAHVISVLSAMLSDAINLGSGSTF